MLVYVALVCVLFVLMIIYTRKTLNYWNKRGVPNFSPKTLLGDLLGILLYKQNIHVFLKNAYHHFKGQGQRFAGIYLATGPIFVPIDYELIKRILIADNEYFNTRGVVIDRENIPLSENLFSANIDKWKYIRDLTTSELTPLKVKRYSSTILMYAKTMSVQIGKVNGPVDILDIAQRYTLDVASTNFFGLDEQHIAVGTSPMIAFVKQINTADMFDLLRVAFKYGLKNPANVLLTLFIKKKTNLFLVDYAKRIYELRKPSNVGRNDALDSMIKALDDEDEPFDFTDYVGQVMTLYLAAIETTSLAITHLLYQLGVMKHVQDKLRKEIIETIQSNGGMVNGDTISEMPYLDRVFHEVTRVHSSLPGLNRLCVKDYKIPGCNVIIEAGTPVFITTLGLHTDPDLFPDPYVFDPDRFLDHRQKHHLLNFGLGAKHCPGRNLGIHIVKCAVVEILRNYEVNVNEKTGNKLETALFSKHLVWKYKNTFWLDFNKLKR